MDCNIRDCISIQFIYPIRFTIEDSHRIEFWSLCFSIITKYSFKT